MEGCETVKYTYLKDRRGRHDYCGGCSDNYSIKEFAGYCEVCWPKLTPHQRAVLQGKEPPVEKVIHTENHTETIRRIYSEGPWLVVACLWLWRIGMSVVVVMLWRALMK